MNAVFGANRDYPYHDHHTDTMTSTYQSYRVGENNRISGGTQKKLFTSKSLLVYATTEADIKLNSTENIEIDILADTFYIFKSNVFQVFYKYSAAQGTIYITPEGVHMREGRIPE